MKLSATKRLAATRGWTFKAEWDRDDRGRFIGDGGETEGISYEEISGLPEDMDASDRIAEKLPADPIDEPEFYKVENGNVEVEYTDTSNLVGTDVDGQISMQTLEELENWLDEDPDVNDFPVVAQEGDGQERYILDGHHRAVVALMNNEPRMPVRTVRLEE